MLSVNLRTGKYTWKVKEQSADKLAIADRRKNGTEANKATATDGRVAR